jgi:hypothetical protein
MLARFSQLTLFIFLYSFNVLALEYSKFEFPGCPENAFCKKETGSNRQKWIEQLRLFSNGKISEQQINTYIQSEFGLPITGWAKEAGSLLPNIILWDSPCKQHSEGKEKFYIAEVFRKNLKTTELNEMNHLLFPKIVLSRPDQPPFSVNAPRGETPLFKTEDSLYYLREEEGIFYGLLIDKWGKFKITKNEMSPKPVIDSQCIEEQIALFKKEAPANNFFQGTHCKDIWDKSSKSYKTILLGWSCN